MWHSVEEEMRDGKIPHYFSPDLLATKDPRVFISTTFPEKPVQKSALAKQVGGDHYKTCGIQPVDYIEANKLGFLEGNVIKYVTRHAKKHGLADLEKAKHYIELLIELRYGENK